MCFKIEWEDLSFILDLKNDQCDCIKSREKRINIYIIAVLLA